MARKIPPPNGEEEEDEGNDENRFPTPSLRRHSEASRYRSSRRSPGDRVSSTTFDDHGCPGLSPPRNGGAVPRRRRNSTQTEPNHYGRRASRNYEGDTDRVTSTSYFDYENEDYLSESEVEGQELYLHFLHERMRYEGLNADEENLSDYHVPSAHDHRDSGPRRGSAHSMNLENFQSPIWRRAGRELQALADQFALSQERERVRLRAESVDVSSLTIDKFFCLLKELFLGGSITRERILVLFFFCSDIAIMAARSQLNRLLSTLTRWSLKFIREQICSWVQQNGGWSAVLNQGLNAVQQVAVIGMCAAIIFCCTIYIRKNI